MAIPLRLVGVLRSAMLLGRMVNRERRVIITTSRYLIYKAWLQRASDRISMVGTRPQSIQPSLGSRNFSEFIQGPVLLNPLRTKRIYLIIKMSPQRL